jgi:hypothetical protein
MESSARAGGEASGRKSRWLWWFVSGLVLGVLGAIFLPDLLRPYLPDMFKGENVEIAGVVEAKSREADRLLLTIDGDAGAVLVTYTHEIPEMDLLIEPGDSVVLAVREYAPFVEDPSVRRVQKGGGSRRSVPARDEDVAAPVEIERRQAPAPTGAKADREPDTPSATESPREPGVVDDSAGAALEVSPGEVERGGADGQQDDVRDGRRQDPGSA